MASSPVPLWESSRVSDGTSSVAQHCNMARVGAVVLSRAACARCWRAWAEAMCRDRTATRKGRNAVQIA
jgi:hypothetical protein